MVKFVQIKHTQWVCSIAVVVYMYVYVYKYSCTYADICVCKANNYITIYVFTLYICTYVCAPITGLHNLTTKIWVAYIHTQLNRYALDTLSGNNCQILNQFFKPPIF